MLFFKLHSTETTGKFFIEISILKVDLQQLCLKWGRKKSTLFVHKKSYTLTTEKFI